MQVKLANTEAELGKISDVLRQLRPQYSEEELIEQIKKQQQRGYQIAYVESTETVLCVAGFVIGEKLAWEKHIYVDDLVTSEEHRSTGAGKFMLDWLKANDAESGCQQLHLDSGVQRFGAHKFYLREEFSITAHHFASAIRHGD
ncbi:MAG: GNAT family N-acetyltransferase [Gammaproteobacteria bacterium]|nr:GNAT family N-acetyltransferase [Gammaproteobacteria bacterium]